MSYFDEPQIKENKCHYCGYECDNTYCSNDCKIADINENCRDEIRNSI